MDFVDSIRPLNQNSTNICHNKCTDHSKGTTILHIHEHKCFTQTTKIEIHEIKQIHSTVKTALVTTSVKQQLALCDLNFKFHSQCISY